MNKPPNPNRGTSLEQPYSVAIREDEEETRRILRREPEGIERIEADGIRERDLQITCDRVLAVIDGSPSPITFYDICRTDAKPPWRKAVLRLIERGVIEANDEKPQRFRRVKR
jgi:hypothetical protein